MDKRPTFYINNDMSLPIRAGGVIFYKQDKTTKQIKILLQYTEKILSDKIKRHVYEDIGGKTDEIDKSINDTIIREVLEETNGVIKKSLLDELLINNHYIYLARSKYYLLLVEAKDIASIDRRAYDKVEITSGRKRQFYWIDAERLKQKGTPFNERIWLIRHQINEYFSTLV
jgi:8-oxo-dGTP pyrophosphatase MutT (NUDIX family)